MDPKYHYAILNNGYDIAFTGKFANEMFPGKDVVANEVYDTDAKLIKFIMDLGDNWKHVIADPVKIFRVPKELKPYVSEKYFRQGDTTYLKINTKKAVADLKDTKYKNVEPERVFLPGQKY